MQHTMITVEGLKKTFGKVEVLKDINFSVEEGTIFALLGSNGAGKTTIIKILSTLLPYEKGQVTIHGLDVKRQYSQVKQTISLTGQFAAVDTILTGRENLMLIAKLRHVKQPSQVTASLLNHFGLADAADRRVSTYSGGMLRRLDISMSLVGNPKVIFLDEPTTGLDPEARIAVWNEIRQLSKHGITIFLTTQYLEEAEQLADRIAILHEGRIIANGTLTELKKQFPPVHVEYVKKQPSLEEIFLAIIGKEEIK